jgi:hypothetical protein
MANRFSDIAKQMGAKVDEESQREAEQEIVQNDVPSRETKVEVKPPSKPLKKALEKTSEQVNEIPITRKTTALPLVLDIAIKEVKERRNIASKIKGQKKSLKTMLLSKHWNCISRRQKTNPILNQHMKNLSI